MRTDSGVNLDDWAKRISITRNLGESDEEFRKRIVDRVSAKEDSAINEMKERVRNSVRDKMNKLNSDDRPLGPNLIVLLDAITEAFADEFKMKDEA